LQSNQSTLRAVVWQGGQLVAFFRKSAGRSLRQHGSHRRVTADAVGVLIGRKQ
jgi:hypothetical protein